MSTTNILLERLSAMINDGLNLSEYGFLTTQLDYSAMRTLFIRESVDRFDIIAINHGISKFQEAKLFINPTYIAFNTVNKILSVVGKKTGFNHHLGMLYPTIMNHPLRDKRTELGMEIGNTIVLRNNKINEEDLSIVLDKIKLYLVNYLFPFFERVYSLQYVNESIINALNNEEMDSCFPMESANMIKLIVMKLCKNEKYVDFLASREKIVEVPQAFRVLYEQRQYQFQWLKDYLDKDQYLPPN